MGRPRRWPAIWLGLVALLVPAVAPARASSGANVRIVEGNASDTSTWGFEPPVLAIGVGTTVVWRNDGRYVHTITSEDRTSDGRAAFASPNLQPGMSWRQTFDAPGTYSYVCSPHPWMKGRLEVKAAP